MATASLSQQSSPQHPRNSRHKPTHTPSASLSMPPQQHPAQQQQAYPAVQPPSARMSPASRYHSNLKVLRRRDPSIISIFDQFSHVCVYHHNGQKWEKHGFEGSMFFFERESYPPYGFYILNRVGMADYVQMLYPEDDISVHGGYLMLRSYPQFTTARLDAIPSLTANTTMHDKFSPMYAYTNDGLSSKQKGESQTIGLWTFTTDGREPLVDVMQRLHSYIKKNLPYPDEYRYGPDRPPPPNPHLRAANSNEPAGNASTNTTTSGTATAGATGNSGGDSQQHPHFGIGIFPTNDEPANMGMSELDKLFAKYLLPSSLPGPNGVGTGDGVMGMLGGPGLVPGPGVGLGLGLGGGTNAQQHQSTASMSVQSLFATLDRSDIAPPPDVHHQPSQHLGHSQQLHQQNQRLVVPAATAIQVQAQALPTMTTGLSLLDSIFASASAGAPAGTPRIPLRSMQQQGFSDQSPIPVSMSVPVPSDNLSLVHPPGAYLQHPRSQYQHHSVQPQQQSISIHSPIPSKSRTLAPAPQVLSQNVIGSLLGLGASGGSEGGSGGEGEGESPSPTHPSSRDGDNELEFDEGTGSNRGSSSDGSGSGHGIGSAFARGKHLSSEQALKNLGIPVLPTSGGGGGGVAGDTTPRPAYGSLGGESSSKGLTKDSSWSTTTSGASATTSSTSTTTTAKTNGGGSNKPVKGRPLVPFEPHSDLWPYHNNQHRSRQLDVDVGNDGGSGPVKGQTEGEGGSATEDGQGEGEIVELDWEDMSVLSDLKEFERIRKAQASAKSKGKANSKGKAPVGTTGVGGGKAGVSTISTANEGGTRKKKKDKRSKKQEQAREDIEKSWDMPTTTAMTAKNGNRDGVADVGTMNLNGRTVPVPVTFHDDSPPASPSPVPSPEVPLSPAAKGMEGPANYNTRIYGHHGQQQQKQEDAEEGGAAQVDDIDINSVSSPSANGNPSTKKKRNRRKLGKTKNGTPVLEEGRVIKSMLSALDEHKTGYVLEKEGFVQEVMRLINENEKFVEDLWRGYYEMGFDA